MFTQNANKIFAQAIDDYHRYDDVDHQLSNPYAEGTIDHLLYMKNWVDTVQWHLEDIIRDPRIDPVEALKIKRRIDKSNQVRTDMVEYIDSYLLDKYKNIDVQPGARINTETPAWAIDRLDPGPEDLPHASGGAPQGCGRGASRCLPAKTRCAAVAAG